MDGLDFRAALARHKGGVDRAVIDRRLASLAAAGIGYYRDGGDRLGVSLYARSRAEDYGIEYRTCAFAIHKQGCYGGLVGRAYGELAEYRALLREARAQRADFVKLMLSGIMDFQTVGGLSGGGPQHGELGELIRIAHGEGFRVMAHVNGADAVRAALEAGVDSVEHGNFMDEDCLRLLRERSAVWVPTLAATAGFVERAGFASGVAAENLRRAAENLRKARALGVLVAAGSDAGAVNVPPDTGIHLEHALLAAAGFTEADIRRGDEAIRSRFRYGA